MKRRIPRKYPEATAAMIVAPEQLVMGRYYMLLTSDSIDVVMTPEGPAVRFSHDGAPYMNVPFVALALCFPLLTIRIAIGKHQGLRQIIDVRCHRIIEVTKRFVATLAPSQRDQIFLSDDGDDGNLSVEYRTRNAFERIRESKKRPKSGQ